MNNLGLIAGNGVFPIEVAKAARRQGIRVVAVAHLNETAAALSAEVDELTWIKVGELERIIEVFKRSGVEQAAMAGGISRARLADSFAPDARALRMLSRIGRFSDDAVLRGVAGEVEAEGIPMIDPVPFIPDALARAGRIAGPDPSAAQLRDLLVIGDDLLGQIALPTFEMIAYSQGFEHTRLHLTGRRTLEVKETTQEIDKLVRTAVR